MTQPPEPLSLAIACASQNVKALEDSLKEKPDLNVLIPSPPLGIRLTPLMIACRHGSPALVKLLLDAGADVSIRHRDPDRKDVQRKTALHFAAEHGDYSIIRMLMDKNADPNAKDSHGCTPLVDLCFAGNLPAFELLLKHGAKPHVTRAKPHITPLMAAVTSRRMNTHKIIGEVGSTITQDNPDDSYSEAHAEIIDQLLINGVDVMQADNRGGTAIHCAAKRADLDILKKLIAANADVNVKDDSDWTPIIAAIHSDHNQTEEVVQYLLDNGADPTMTQGNDDCLADIERTLYQHGRDKKT